MKKNLEGEASECDKMRLLGSQTDLILNPPGIIIQNLPGTVVRPHSESSKYTGWSKENFTIEDAA